MTNTFTSIIKAAALIGIGAGAALYAPVVLGPLDLPFVGGAQQSAAAPEAGAPVADQSGPKAPSIRVIPAANIEIVETITATGSVMPRETALVGSDVQGLLVEELFFDVGDTVKKGDRLARLDRSTVELQLAQIEAQAAQIEANLAQARSQTVDAEIGVRQAQEQFDRVAPLVKSGVASKAQLDTARNGLDSAKARLASANQAVLVVESQKAVTEAQRKQTVLQLEKTELVSPVDGLVLARSAAIGQVVSGAAGPLFTIATDSAFELAAEVSESELARLSAGMKVAVTLPGRDAPMGGEIRLISPQVDARSRLGTVKVALPADPALRNGSFARGVIEIARSTGVAIPAAAVLYRGRDAYVQKVVDGRIASTPVELGLRDNVHVEVRSGLALGDEVVSRAGTFVSDGDAVLPVRDDQLTGATN